MPVSAKRIPSDEASLPFSLHDWTRLAPALEPVGPGIVVVVSVLGTPAKLALALGGMVGFNFVVRVVNPAFDAVGICVKKRIKSRFEHPRGRGG